MPERDHFRAHARRRVNLDATLRDNVGSLAQDVRIRDLGLGGACLELIDARSSTATSGAASSGARWLDPEAIVSVEVTAPSLWDPLTLRGKIAWFRRGGAGRPARAGIRFDHRDAPALFALYQLLEANAFDV